jgi:hypothetical protein
VGILLGFHCFLSEHESTAARKSLHFMGSALAKVKSLFTSEQDSEASTRANTKSNAKPIPVTPVRRTQSFESPRAVRSSDDNGTASSGTTAAKKQKIKRQARHAKYVVFMQCDTCLKVSFNRTVKERVFFEESVSDDEGGRASPVSRPYKEKHPAGASRLQGEVLR